MIDVDEVDAAGMVPYPDFTGTGIADRDIGQLHHVGVAEAFDLDRFHGRGANVAPGWPRRSSPRAPGCIVPPMLAVVTGGAGFIGSHTVDRLIGAGHRVVVLDDFRTGKRANLAQHAGGGHLDIVACDISHGIFGPLAPLVAKHGPVERIVHLAPQVSVVYSVDNPLVDMAVNYGRPLH